MAKSAKKQSEKQQQEHDQDNQPKPPRGRPSKRVVKIDDTPRNVARALFGIRSTKYPRPNQ